MVDDKKKENKMSMSLIFILFVSLLFVSLFIQSVEVDTPIIGISGGWDEYGWEEPIIVESSWKNVTTTVYENVSESEEPFFVTDVNFSHVKDDVFSLSFRANYYTILVIVDAPGLYYESISGGPLWTDFHDYYYISEDPEVLFFITVDIYNFTEWCETDEPQNHVQLNMSAMIPAEYESGVWQVVVDDDTPDLPVDWFGGEPFSPRPIGGEEAAFNEFIISIILVVMFIIFLIIVFYLTPQEKKNKKNSKEYKSGIRAESMFKSIAKERKHNKKLDGQAAKLADHKILTQLDSLLGWSYSLPFRRYRNKRNYRKTYKKLRKECSEVREIKRLHELAKQTIQQDKEKKAEWAFLKMCDMKAKIDKMFETGQNESCAKFAALRKELVEMEFNIPEEI